MPNAVTPTRRQATICRNRSALPLTCSLSGNLRAVAREATATLSADAASDARRWYLRHHAVLSHLAHEFSLPLRQVVGVCAALSPQTDWPRNLRLTRDMLADGDCRHMSGNAIEKARSILADPLADPLATLRGRKVRSFYRNLLAPFRSGAVTIDRHALSILFVGLPVGLPSDHRHGARTHTLSNSQLKTLERPGSYVLLAGVYRSVARELGMLPHELQSLTWSYWTTNHAYRAGAA